jgi:hypothetical protein
MVAVKSRPKKREQLALRYKVDEILARPAAPLVVSQPPLASAFEPEVISKAEVISDIVIEDREPFGRWLITQKDRGDWIDPLAAAARKDPRFPRTAARTMCASTWARWVPRATCWKRSTTRRPTGWHTDAAGCSGRAGRAVTVTQRAGRSLPGHCVWEAAWPLAGALGASPTGRDRRRAGVS